MHRIKNLYSFVVLIIKNTPNSVKTLKNIWKGITVNTRNNFAIMNNKAKEGDTNLGLIILGGI